MSLHSSLLSSPKLHPAINGRPNAAQTAKLTVGIRRTSGGRIASARARHHARLTNGKVAAAVKAVQTALSETLDVGVTAASDRCAAAAAQTPSAGAAVQIAGDQGRPSGLTYMVL